MALIGNYLYRYFSDRLSSYPRELIKKLKAVFRMFHNQEYSQIMLKAFRLIFNNVQLILIINKNKIEYNKIYSLKINLKYLIFIFKLF